MPTGVYIRTKPDPKKGRPLSEEHRKKIQKATAGENNPFFGKHHTEDTRKKISESRKGKYTGESNHMFGKITSDDVREKQSKARLGKYSGLNHPMYGKHHTEESKLKNKLAHAGKNNAGYGKPKSNETKEKIRKALSGEKCYMWKGGISFKPYCNRFSDKRKENVRNFFNGYCICSGIHQNDCLRKHSVHHIDHDKEQGCNGKPFNLVPMCADHHNREQHNEEEYKLYINKTLRDGFKWGIWNEQEYMEKVMY